jgi:hypothetical protein
VADETVVGPLHRLVNWDVTAGRAPFVGFLSSWVAVGAFIFLATAFQETPNWRPAVLFGIIAFMYFAAAVVQSLIRLWKWEERRQEAQTATADRIAELESELGISDA